VVPLRGFGFVRVFRMVSNDLGMTEGKRKELERRGWGIEIYHRGLKQCCGVEKAQARKAVSILPLFGSYGIRSAIGGAPPFWFSPTIFLRGKPHLLSRLLPLPGNDLLAQVLIFLDGSTPILIPNGVENRPVPTPTSTPNPVLGINRRNALTSAW